jgi:serine protease Do
MMREARSSALALATTLFLGVVSCRGESSSTGSGGAAPAVPTSTGESAASPPAKAVVAKPPPPPPVPVDPPIRLQSGIASFAPIARHADPSVVTILTAGSEIEPSPFFTRRGVKRETQGLGTGFIVDKDGVILTNNHVIKDADTITVRLSNDREYPAKVVGRDPRTDIAVVRIDEHGLTPLALGDSDVIDVGDWVVAIGNPFGLSHTVSAGIISAKGRNRKDVPLDPSGYYNFLQTDASINPGNSGGPLLNLNGDVVGINTAIRGGGAQGIGFAIPINMVKQLLPMLLRDGHITRSALGVRIFDVGKLTPQDRAALKLPDDAKGALVEYATPGGPAASAGIKQGDVIQTFEGATVEAGSLQWKASTAGVGRPVTLGIARAGKTFETKVTLGVLEEPPAPKEEP